MRWLQAHKNWTRTDCLTFPYARNDRGYGVVLFQGKIGGAHRAMCFLAHGAPSSDELVAAHSCGMGHTGCVNPGHLRWATQVENAQDLAVHRDLGIAAPTPSRLSSADCQAIVAMKGREYMRVTARRFGISESMVCRIQKGNRRKITTKALA